MFLSTGLAGAGDAVAALTYCHEFERPGWHRAAAGPTASPAPAGSGFSVRLTSGSDVWHFKATRENGSFNEWS